MADTVVQIPGVGNVAFPASMSEADISTAAAKLHAQHTISQPTAAQMLSRDPSLHATSDGPDPEPSTLDKVNALLGPYAHPQTLADLGRILTLPVDSLRKALVSAASMAAARQPVGNAIAATGRGMEAVGNSRAARIAENMGGAEAAWHLDPKGAAVALAPTGLRMAGRGMQRAGAAIATVPEATTVAEEAAPAATAGPRTINDAMKAALDQARTAATSRAASPVASAPVVPVPPAAQSAVAVGPTSPAGPLSQVPKLKLSGDESKLYMALRKSGNSHAEAVQAIEAQRAMVARYGLPTSAEVRTNVAERNTTGRWQE